MGYKVKLHNFEGPFDLLVYLIENAEMSIYDIQVAEITRQYMDYVAQMRRVDPLLAGEFMVLAASLIEIKSKMLLPRMRPDNSGLEPEDPRNELVQQLLEYKRFKAVAAYLERREEAASRFFEKPQEDISTYEEHPDELLSTDLEQFIHAFILFLQKKKRIEEVHHEYDRIERQRMTVEGRIEQLKDLFRSKKKLRFRELLGEERTRRNVVLTFVSILELMRQRSIGVRQNINFGEMVITVKAERSEKS